MTASGFPTQGAIMVALDNENTEVQPPATFAQYASLFSIVAVEQLLIPLGSSVVVYMDKFVRNAVGSAPNSPCSFDVFETSVAFQGFVSSDPVNASMPQDSSVVMSFNRLLVRSECFHARYGIFQALGIVGGGVAIVLFSTLALTKVTQWALGKYMASTPSAAGAERGSSSTAPYHVMQDIQDP